MARAKNSKPAKKKTAPKGRGVKVVEDVSVKGGRGFSRQAGAIVIFALAFLLLSISLIPGKNVWCFFHGFFFALFGPCAFLWPPVLIYIAIMAASDKPVSSITAKLWEAFALIALICAAVHIFTIGSWPGLSTLYGKGSRLLCGGIAGGIIGAPLFSLFGRAGAAITVFLLIFVFLVLMTGVTLMQILSFVFPASKERKTSADAAALEPKPVFFHHKKPKFNIDIDLGPDDAAENLPIHPIQNSKSEQNADKNEKQKDKSNDGSAALDALVSKVTGEGGEKPLAAKDADSETVFKDETGVQTELYSYPPTTLLKTGKPPAAGDISGELKANAELLVDTLKSFGVETRIIDISRGPAVTRYELQPSAGVKISRITSLADDIALNLAAAGVRIEAPIPNKAAVGIEVPNKAVSVVNIREIIDSNEFRDAPGRLTFSLGRDIAGNIAVGDIAKMPHVLIAGATGSGKSVCINSIIISLLYKSSPEEVRFLLVDPKVVELGIYNGIPHLLVPVVTEPHKAAGALNWAVAEMLKRYKLFAEHNVRDIRGFNELASRADELSPMPQIVIIIDELADLMMAAPNDVEDAICRLAQMARAAGMHLVIATQRPSVDVITGVIKANIPSRIAFAVSSQVDSRTILDMGGAEKLLGRGDMLFMPVGAQKPVRIQGCFVSDKEVEDVIDFIKKSHSSEYSEDIMDEIEKNASEPKGKAREEAEGDEDAMMPQAIECIVEAGVASTSLLQRRLKLGYARAARIIDQMEQKGFVGPLEGSKPRQVLITRQQFLEMQLAKKD